MRIGNWIAVLLVCVAAMFTPPPQARSQAGRSQVDKIVESEHHAGPNGLEGWKLSKPFSGTPNSDPLPFRLLIAQNGKIVRKIEGKPFVWRWIFWRDGRQVAYETGPLHFGMVCHLADVRTGRVMESIDCFHELQETAPAWAKALEAAR